MTSVCRGAHKACPAFFCLCVCGRCAQQRRIQWSVRKYEACRGKRKLTKNVTTIIAVTYQ